MAAYSAKPPIQRAHGTHCIHGSKSSGSPQRLVTYGPDLQAGLQMRCWAQPHLPSPDYSTQHCQALEYARLPGITQVTTSGRKTFPTFSFKCWHFSLPGGQANYSPLPQAFALLPSPHLSPVTNCLLLFKGLFQTFKKYKKNATKDNPPRDNNIINTHIRNKTLQMRLMIAS